MTRTLMLAVVLSWSASARAQNRPNAVADGETLEGVSVGETLAVFKGVPFAAPPVGDLRWRPPTRHQPGSGIRRADEFSASCAQNNRLQGFFRNIAATFGAADKISATAPTSSEDCLYLNVWTPNLSARQPPLPVMVWIHGGSNTNGEGSSPTYDGSALAKKGVVVVTINYRLGVFGFMAHPALTAESPSHSSGNYGLLDQIEALKWVRRNIGAFGGDSDRVTVFGESAGSTDIMHLMASPLAKGLFQRAIAESGAPMGAMSPLTQAQLGGVAVFNELAADSPDPLQVLRAASTQFVLAAGERVMSSGQSMGPIVDGWVIPDLTARVFDAGKEQPVPLLVGTNALEMSVLSSRAAHDARSLEAVTDLYFTCPTRIAARAVSKTGAPVFLYQFTRVLPGGEKLGAFHSLEIQYVFGNPMPWLSREAVDDRLSATMMDYWVRFAATGDPNGAGAPQWPRYGASDEYMELGTTVRAGRALKKDVCDAIEPKHPRAMGRDAVM
jgi:para-nitrobenzyl esterase